MLRRVAFVRPDVSEERAAARVGEVETTSQ
jgi:hypothetical protein